MAIALLAPLALGGCGGIEFQGKVFDYMGLSGLGQDKQDVRMADRAPLVIPPDTRTLPAPGEGAAVATARPDWPVDSDHEQRQIVADKEAAEKQKQAFVEPGNPYAGKPTLLDKLLTRKKTPNQDLVDVPEPDPSDMSPEERARQQKSVASAALPPRPMVPDPAAPAAQDDPFHPAAPDSYKQMNSGNAGAPGM